MLIIAISFGSSANDAYTCSVSAEADLDANPENAQECLDFICREQKLTPIEVDEVLVIGVVGHEPEVKHHYTAGNDFGGVRE